MNHSVLFVCTANICRSPMAMGLLQEMTSDDPGIWRIKSAGVWADSGYPAAGNTQKILKEKGIDLKSHRSQPITRELVSNFRLILVMEKNHKEALQIAFPELASRIYLLTEMVDRSADIIDPIGGALVDYEETAFEIQSILKKGWKKIRKLSKEGNS